MKRRFLLVGLIFLLQLSAEATVQVFFQQTNSFAAINLDGSVDLLDLKLLTTDWLKQQSGLGSDLDGNGKIDFNDFGILGENWSLP